MAGLLLPAGLAPAALAPVSLAHCDALFRVRLRTGHEARIFVLLEHKSYLDSTTPLQLLRYMIDIWKREIEGGAARDGLPAIVPLVLYHGPGRWTVPRSVIEMVDAPEELEPLLRNFAYVLHDLGDIVPLRLSRTPEVRAGLLALRVHRFDEIPSDLLDLIVGGPVAGSEFERHILKYIVERMNLTPPMLEASLRRTKPDRWEALMGTVAEAWIEQGRAEGREEGLTQGIEKGLADGRAGILLRQLELRFGILPDAAGARVRGASVFELEAWAEAVLVAASLEEVLATEPKR